MTPIDELPDAPDPATDSPTEFSAKAAAFVLAQRALPGQVNTFVGEAVANIEALAGRVDSYAAGGAYALPYIFDTATADADPGAGKLRLSSATQNAATVMRVDVTAGGQDFTTLLDSFSASSSTVKGAFRLVKQGDPSKWMTFNMTARAAPSGYRNFTVVCTDSSSASPFANGDPLMLFFQRSGDKGEDAVGALQLLSSVTVSSAVAQIDFLNIFSAAYDKYIIELQNITPSVGSQLQMHLAVGGVADSGAQYRYKWDNGQMSTGSNISQIPLCYAQGNAYTLTVEVRNANGSGAKSIGWRGTQVLTVSPLGDCVVCGEGVYRGANPASGFRLYMGGPAANITAGTVRVYGVKNFI
jgi:hypothetical protein